MFLNKMETVPEQDIDRESTTLEKEIEDKVSEVLQVDEETEINQDIVEKIKVLEPEIKPVKKQNVRTRGFLIDKIKESAEVVGNQEEVKSMRLHRRRRKSLENILKEQVDTAINSHAEQIHGIPQEEEARVSYAVDMLYSFDLMVCKGIEKACEFVDMCPIECCQLSETIDGDPRIKNEIKKGFEDWIRESPGMQSWVDQCSSPSTRILLCHLYPLMSCLKIKDKNAPPKRIPVSLQVQAGLAKIRAQVDPPIPRRVPLKRSVRDFRRPLPKARVLEV